MVNANLTLSEILTISVIILIVFGPQRLPELARKAGAAVGRLRQAAASVRQELTAGTEEISKPLADIDRDLRAAKADLQASIPGLDDLVPTRRPAPASPPDVTPPEPAPTGSTPVGTGPTDEGLPTAETAPDLTDEPGEAPSRP